MTRAAAFLQPGWADWEIGPVASVLKFHVGAELSTFTPDGAEAVSVGGLRLRPDGRYSDPAAREADVLLVIGSDAWVGFDDPQFFKLLRNSLAAGKIVGVICAGTAAAAKAGLFEGRAHTSNGRDWLTKAVPGYAGADRYVDTPKAVADGRLVSAPGSAPQTFTAEIVRLIIPDKPQVANDYLALAGKEFSP